jgi:hypothetical protein
MIQLDGSRLIIIAAIFHIIIVTALHLITFHINLFNPSIQLQNGFLLSGDNIAYHVLRLPVLGA